MMSELARIESYEANRIPPSNDPRWYAVQTVPRHEKKVSNELTAKGMCCFLPVVPRVSQWSDRRRIIEAPLFPGYVFARIIFRSPVRLALLSTKGVVGLVGARGLGTPIPEHEISAIQEIVEKGVPIEARGGQPAIGQRVRIRGGALDGLEGVLESVKGDQSLIVSIEAIQRSVSVTITGYCVEAIPETPQRDRRSFSDAMRFTPSFQ